jgi:hypothetical protein
MYFRTLVPILVRKRFLVLVLVGSLRFVEACTTFLRAPSIKEVIKNVLVLVLLVVVRTTSTYFTYEGYTLYVRDLTQRSMFETPVCTFVLVLSIVLQYVFCNRDEYRTEQYVTPNLTITLYARSSSQQTIIAESQCKYWKF